MALGPRTHRGRHPHAGPTSRMTSRNNHRDQERRTPGAVDPRPPGTTAGQSGTTRPEKSPARRNLGPARQGRERSRLTACWWPRRRVAARSRVFRTESRVPGMSDPDGSPVRQL
jgi:hypothetical protein